MAWTRDLLNLSYVQRWVIAPTTRPQTVAEHSFRVAAIVWGLHSALQLPLFNLSDAILLALEHDREEVYTGDTPGTAKDRIKAWTNPDHMMNWERVVKVADAIETYDWWQRWGMKEWTHPDAPAKGDQNRDIRKIIHYCQGWPELLEAAKNVMHHSMGYGILELEQTFGHGTD